MELNTTSNYSCDGLSMDRVLNLTQYPSELNMYDLMQSCPNLCNILADEGIGNGNPDLAGIGVSRLPIVTTDDLYICICSLMGMSSPVPCRSSSYISVISYRRCWLSCRLFFI